MTHALIDKVGQELPHKALPARNALVEAFALHVRVVSDFHAAKGGREVAAEELEAVWLYWAARPRRVAAG